MDDGSRHGDGMHIGVYAFTNADVDKLMFVLQDKFNIKCSIHYNKDKKPRIYIFKESMDTLITLVKPSPRRRVPRRLRGILLKKCYINWGYKAVRYYIYINPLTRDG